MDDLTESDIRYFNNQAGAWRLAQTSRQHYHYTEI